MIGPYAENSIVVGDCGNHLHEIPDESVTAVLSDPPYGLAFMGKDWDEFKSNADYQAWVTEWATELLRVCVPGAVGLFFGGTRTSHRLACGLEDAGWEVYDTLMYMYGSGFPKSYNIAKGIEGKALLGTADWSKWNELDGEKLEGRIGYHKAQAEQGYRPRDYTEKERVGKVRFTTPAAQTWDGYGTALKPAWEPIILARKPRKGTYAQCAVEGGAGALWVDGCRIGIAEHDPDFRMAPGNVSIPFMRPPGSYETVEEKARVENAHPLSARHNAQGRWPANLILSHSEGCRRVGVKRVKGTPKSYIRATDSENQNAYGKGIGEPMGRLSVNYADADGLETVEEWNCVEGCPVRQLDEMSLAGGMHSAGSVKPPGGWGSEGGWGFIGQGEYGGARVGDKGGASRFFYTAKASRSERNAGLEGMEEKWIDESRKPDLPGGNNPRNRGARSATNNHPTVKPLALTEYLARLIRPPEAYLDDAVLLVPFAGSGSEIIGAIKAGWRRWLGIEISEEYAEIARARIAYWQGQVEADRLERAQMEMDI